MATPSKQSARNHTQCVWVFGSADLAGEFGEEFGATFGEAFGEALAGAFVAGTIGVFAPVVPPNSGSDSDSGPTREPSGRMPFASTIDHLHSSSGPGVTPTYSRSAARSNGLVSVFR